MYVYIHACNDRMINLITCININFKTHFIIDEDGKFIHVMSIYDTIVSCHIAESRVLEGRWATLRLASRGAKTRLKQEKDVILLEKGVIRLFPYFVRVNRDFPGKSGKRRFLKKKALFLKIQAKYRLLEVLEGVAGRPASPPI